MGFVNKAVLAAGLVASAAAVNVKVRSSGGNSTKHFGIDYGYGFLHEDINNSGDGGIYAELIQNRAFQYSDAFPVNTSHYYPINGADLSIQFLGHPLSDALPASMRVSTTNGSGQVGFENEGYWGMDVKAANEYTGSFWVKGAYKGCFTASFKSNLTDDVFGSVEIESKSVANDWTEHAFTLQPERDAPNSNNTFAVTFDPAGTSNGTLDFNLISVFPPTYKGRKNGLRIDIAEALEELNPTFIRFPGGNMLEGLTLGSWWDWKNTLGPLKNRPGFQGVWGYQQTNGLGIQEYLEWSEDMDLEVVVGCYAGLALDGNYTSPEELKPFVDDCLNQIEFIKGPASSEWGARRAELGHPEPYRLDYVEIGNEDWLAGYPGGWDSYKEYRFKMFFDAITKVYPDMQVIGSAASSDPAGIDPVTLELKNATDTIKYPEGVIGDYHPYREPDELVEEFDRFDNDYGHIVGEVAATHVNNGTRWEGNLYYFPWWIGSVGEAASLIGYERNSDRIPMTLYAPVLRNMNRWQWAITILQFAADPALTTRSTSWYVWSLFAHHPISETLPTTGSYGPVWWGAGKDEARDALVWKAACYNTTNGADEPVVVRFDGVKRGQKATLTVLTNNVGDPYAYNDPLAGNNIVDSTTTVLTADKKGAFHFSMPQLSVAVLDTDVEVDAPGGNPPKGGPGGYGKPPRYGGKKGGKHHGPPK